MSRPDSFYGTGWGFPVTFSKRRGCTVRMVENEEDIRESLQILFSTRPSERVMRPDYGGSLEELVFEPNNIGLVTYVKDLISKAILYYEPRVDLEDVVIDQTNINAGFFQIELILTIRSTNSRFNFVFPYYLNEATIAE